MWPWKKGTARGIALRPLYPSVPEAAERNPALLERAAELLGEALLEQLVFVGGAVVGLLITDPAMLEIRPTQDVANART